MIFKTPPPDFKKEIDVVGCYMFYDGKFLMLYRAAHKKVGSKWGLPAGKVDTGETLHQAMVREIKEETGIEVAEADVQFSDSQYVRNEGHDFVFHVFSCQLDAQPNVTLNPNEHQRYQWVTPSEALSMDLMHDFEEGIQVFFKLKVRI